MGKGASDDNADVGRVYRGFSRHTIHHPSVIMNRSIVLLLTEICDLETLL